MAYFELWGLLRVSSVNNGLQHFNPQDVKANIDRFVSVIQD